MSDIPPSPPPHDFEGDYRPAEPAHLDPINARIEPADVAFLMRLTDTLNTTLDLQTLLARTSELVRAVIPYRIFAIFLLNDRTHELRMRFQIGHTPQVERTRVPVGKGVVGQVALTRQPILLNDVSTADYYIDANPGVRSELAVPLIAKNRLIGVMDIESEQPDFFRPEHLHVLTMTASRIAQAIENARLYARVSRQAQTLEVLNEIAVELASILDLNPLLERVGQLLRRLIDYQMFSILLLDEKGETLITRYAWRFGYSHAPMRRIPVTSGLVGAAVREWRPINVPDVAQDPRYLPMNPETRSELIVPLFYKGRVIGVLDLEHTRPNFFNEEHERMLTTLASQIAIAIENARLYQAVHRQETPARERHRHGPRGAASPAAARGSFASSRRHGRPLPARAHHRRRPLRFSRLRPQSHRHRSRRRQRQGRARRALRRSGQRHHARRRRAASGARANARPPQRRPPGAQARIAVRHHALRLWNDENQTLQVANSGAVQPVFCRAGQSLPVNAEGFPLGMFPNVTYEEFSVATQPGDAIVFVSDGILDAENEKEEMYGQERLAGLLCASRDLPAQEIADAILADVSRFQGSKDRFDDETIIVLSVR